MDKQTKIEIMKLDGCTEREAERHIERGSVVFDDLAENLDWYLDEWGIDGDEAAPYHEMVAGGKVLDDWGKVQLNGKAYYIMYVL